MNSTHSERRWRPARHAALALAVALTSALEAANNSARACEDGVGSLTQALPGIGGGIANFGALALRDSSVLSNTASLGAGLANLGTLTAVNSTLSGNQAHVDGGPTLQ